VISLGFVYFFCEAFPSIEISLNDFKGYFFRVLSLEEDFGLSLKAAHWIVGHIVSMSSGRRNLEKRISRVFRTDKFHVLLFGASAIEVIANSSMNAMATFQFDMSLGRTRNLKEWISRLSRARTDKLHVLLFLASAIKVIFDC